MVESKKWNWAKIPDKLWMEPSEDVYYYVDRWKKNGFSRFLDLGCGRGRHSLLFSQNGFNVDAFDLSQEGIDILEKCAAEAGLRIETTLGDILQLPYEPGSFDCLLAYHVISHTDTQGIRVVVNEIQRVLKGGGEFFISLCSKRSPSYACANYPRADENTIIKTQDRKWAFPIFTRIWKASEKY